MKPIKHIVRAGVTFATVGALAVVTTGTAPAAEAVSSNSNYTAEVKLMESIGAPSISEDELLTVFKALEEIPDNVLQSGDTATQSWLENRLGKDLPSNPSGITTYGTVGCVSAIGLALVTNLPVFKVTKIRTALKAAGGATTFVKNFKRAYDAQRNANASFNTAVSRGVKEAAKTAGPEAQQLLIELFNLGNVYSACFE